jgi:hypothetical protein
MFSLIKKWHIPSKWGTYCQKSIVYVQKSMIQMKQVSVVSFLFLYFNTNRQL